MFIKDGAGFYAVKILESEKGIGIKYGSKDYTGGYLALYYSWPKNQHETLLTKNEGNKWYVAYPQLLRLLGEPYMQRTSQSRRRYGFHEIDAVIRQAGLSAQTEKEDQFKL